LPSFFNVQLADIDCKIQNNDAISFPSSPNKLDSSKKMEKFIPIVGREGYVAIVATLGQVQYSGYESIIERLN